MKISNSAKIHKTATVCGSVTLGENVSVWCNVVIRGDQNTISIGNNSNVQDNAVIHCAKEHPCTIGEYTTIGHSAIVHGCTVGNHVIIGMGSIILDGSIIGDGCTIGAGAVIPRNKTIEKNCVVVGNPYKVLKVLSNEEGVKNKQNAIEYIEYSKSL